jgi:hypothetical protein
LLVHVGNIVLWSNVETTIGLVLGSLPALRRVFRYHAEKQASTGKGSSLNARKDSSFGLTTFGGTPSTNRRPANKSFRNPSDVGVSITTIHTRGDGGDWKRLQDETFENDKLPGIRAEYTYNVELSRDPDHLSLRSSDGSKNSVAELRR